jgi:hypothetical protein
MRITTRYTLRNYPITKKLLKDSLIEDIENIAKAKFDDEFQAFKIEIKLTPIEKYNGYK